MNEKEVQAVRQEAKQILADFGKSLGKVKLGKAKIGDRGESTRKEGSSMIINNGFRKQIFANAPESDENHIYAEKKQW